MRNYLLVLALPVLLASCTQNTNDDPKPAAERPDKFANIKASSSFNWSSERQMTLNINGTPTVVKVDAPLSVYTASGKLLLTVNHTMDVAQALYLTVPSNETKLTLKFGSITKEVNVSSFATVDFLPVLPETAE
jgi:hypothetical protein